MEPAAIRDLVRRLARPHGEDTVIVEGVAIRAAGSDFHAVEEWILANGGRPEAVIQKSPPAGLHGARFADSEAHRKLGTARYIVPSAALEPPDEDETGERSSTDDG